MDGPKRVTELIDEERQGGKEKGEDKAGEGGRKGQSPTPEETAGRKVIRTGSVVVRVPPEQLDSLVLDLRKELGKIGELKGQRLTSEDVSKKYTDYQSQLRSARTMEERLLKIIREGKGQIKDLVMAEEALGKYHKEIEVLEGELRWLANQVALSTLTINLTEKEIRAAAAVKESEKVRASVEVEDVDKARREVEDAVLAAKGRLLKSDMKQRPAGQFRALTEFEVATDKAGPLWDHLKQLGTLTHLESERVQQAEGGVLGLKNGKMERGPTHFTLSLYNLANIEPRETITLRIAATDVPALFRKLRAAIAKGPNRVAQAALNEQDQQNITAQLNFDVRRKDQDNVFAVLDEGTILSRQTTRAPASDKVTDAKVGFQVDLVPASTIPPRETMTLGLRVSDVEGTLTLFKAQVKEVGGRTVQPVLRQDPDGRVTAYALFIVPLSAAPGLFEKFKTAGRVSGQRVDEHPQAPIGKLALAQLDVTLSNMELLVPADKGFWAQVRHGLSLSFRGLFWSLSWLIVGVLFVLPWVLLIWAVVWLVRRIARGSTPAPTGG
jgi:hypothetical protein